MKHAGPRGHAIFAADRVRSGRQTRSESIYLAPSSYRIPLTQVRDVAASGWSFTAARFPRFFDCSLWERFQLKVRYVGFGEMFRSERVNAKK